jgi:hypothetical protein
MALNREHQPIAWRIVPGSICSSPIRRSSSRRLHELELLETLSLGIEGKKSLWMALQHVSANDPSTPRMDYDRLIGRAQEQRAEVDARRLDVAWNALR